MSSQIHRGSVSQITQISSQNTNDIEELTDAELLKQVDDLKYQIRVMALENEIFEKTILRLDPSLMQGIQQALDYANKLQNTSLAATSFIKSQTSKFAMDSLTSPSRMLTSPSKISSRKGESPKVGGTVVFGRQRINVLERSELVSTEMEVLITNLEKARAKAAKQHALLKAQLEEIGIKMMFEEKASSSFQETVIENGWDKIAQRIPAEIWVRYMNEWMKIADSMIGKQRLRISTLNTQYSKLKGQINVKAELSEALRPVDFERLKIMNKEALEVIDRKLVQLGELKKLTGEANLNLTVHKKMMVEQKNYLTKIVKAIKTKNRQVVDIDRERLLIESQVKGLEVDLKEVKEVRQAYEVPDVMDYVGIKAELTDLQHSIKVLENRRHIQQIALQSLNKKLHSMLL